MVVGERVTRPATWVEGVLIRPEVALGVAALLRQGQRWAKQNGIALPDDVAEVVAGVEALARAVRQRDADVPMSSMGRPENGGSVTVAAMSTSEFALRAGCSRRHASRIASEGRLGARRAGRSWVFDRAAAEAALAAEKESHA